MQKSISRAKIVVGNETHTNMTEIWGSIRYIYLVPTNVAISAVLIYEREREQKPIYFTNQMFQWAKVRY